MKNTTATSSVATATLTTKHLAKHFGMRPTQLRRILRSMERYADGVHTNYRWTGMKDPAIAQIAKAITLRKATTEAAAKAAKAALKKAAPAKAKKSPAPEIAARQEAAEIAHEAVA